VLIEKAAGPSAISTGGRINNRSEGKERKIRLPPSFELRATFPGLLSLVKGSGMNSKIDSES